MNQEIFYFLNNIVFRYEWLDTGIIFCAQWLPFWLVGIFIIFQIKSYLGNNQKKTLLLQEVIKTILIVLGSVFLIWAISQIINYFYYSPRPFLVLSDVNSLFFHGDGDSFPSGHATFFFSLAFMSYYYSPRLLTAFLLDGAIIVSFARIISGVHWPSDILGALILSLVGVLIIRKTILEKFKFAKK